MQIVNRSMKKITTTRRIDRIPVESQADHELGETLRKQAKEAEEWIIYRYTVSGDWTVRKHPEGTSAAECEESEFVNAYVVVVAEDTTRAFGTAMDALYAQDYDIKESASIKELRDKETGVHIINK